MRPRTGLSLSVSGVEPGLHPVRKVQEVSTERVLMSEEEGRWFVTWTVARIQARKKRVERLQARMNEPPHRIEVDHLRRWMAFAGFKTLTELVQLRKQHF